MVLSLNLSVNINGRLVCTQTRVRSPISSSKLIMHQGLRNSHAVYQDPIYFRISFPYSLRRFRSDRLINRNYTRLVKSSRSSESIAFTIIRCLLGEALRSLSLSFSLLVPTNYVVNCIYRDLSLPLVKDSEL